MLLYADSKLDKLQSLATELNNNAKDAKEMLSPTHIKAAMQTQFNSLQTQNTNQMNDLKQSLENEINTLIQESLETLKNDATTQNNQALKEFLNDEKLKTLVELNPQEITARITQDFITNNTEQMHNEIKQDLTQQGEAEIKESIKTYIQEHFTHTLQELIIQYLQESPNDPLAISLPNDQIEILAERIYDNQSNTKAFYIAFSKIFNAKLQTNTELIHTIQYIFSKNIKEFHESKALDFKFQILKQYNYINAQLDNIAFSNHLLLKKDLDNLKEKHEQEIATRKLEFEKDLQTKRKEWQDSLEKPDSIKHNILQAI